MSHGTIYTCDLRAFDALTPTARLHRLCVGTAGTPVIDGYLTVSLSFMIPLVSGPLGMNALEIGLLACLYLIGAFFGSLIFGRLSDRIGRRRLFLLLPLTVMAMSLLQLTCSSAAGLMLLRFLLGFFVGADYPVGQALLTENSPAGYRSKALVILMATWSGGAIVAAFVCRTFYYLPQGWMSIAMSAAWLCALVFVLRLGMPESIRWLLARGREREAREGLRRLYGTQADVGALKLLIEPIAASKEKQTPRIRRAYLRRLVMVSLFWLCQCIPVTAIFMFGPMLAQALSIASDETGYAEVAGINLIFMLGSLLALRLINRVGRRPLIASTYAVMTLCFIVIALCYNCTLLLGIAFVFYAFAYGLQCVLNYVYPNELFPTAIRATAVGIVTAVAHAGAAASAFLFPYFLHTCGVQTVFAVGAGILMTGFAVTWFMAVETRGKGLEEASRV